jgi:hypothetical protein
VERDLCAELRALYTPIPMDQGIVYCLTIMLSDKHEATERYHWYLSSLGPRKPEPMDPNLVRQYLSLF